MCNSNLDTSADAILSRLSKLETAVAAGRIGAAAPSQAPIAEKPLVEPTKKSDTANAEAKPSEKKEDVASAEQLDPICPPVAEPVKDGGLKILRGWNEIAESAAADDGSILAFLKMGKAFIDGNRKIYIKFPSDFVRSMVDRPDVKNKVHGAICVARGPELASAELIFGVIDGNEDSVTDLDDLQV